MIQKKNNAGFTLSADGLKLSKITIAAIHENGHFKIPDSVTSIGAFAFYFFTSLTTVHIPGSVTKIGSYAFVGCTSLTNIIIDTDNESELNRIKNLLPKDLRDKVISRSVYEIQRNIVGNFFNHALSEAGLPVTDVNQIITSYLSEPLVCILGFINRVRRCTFLPNDESKTTYRELLAQSIGRVFPNFNADQANDQKQAGPARLLTHEEVHEVENQDVIHDHHADEKESPVQDQQGSTSPTPGFFPPVAHTTGAPQAASQAVAPTRGQRHN